MATAKPSNLMLIAVGVREDGNNLISNEARVACRVTPVSDEDPPLFPSEPQRAQRETLVPMTSRYD
jgi:hypothetical protein